MKWTLQEIVGIVGSVKAVKGGVEVRGVSTDTRTLKPGDLYVALKGDQFDGHDFVEQAFEKGAAGALVHSRFTFSFYDELLISVPNTLAALQKMAEAYRSQFTIPVIGITGSNGKTTTKEMISEVLSEKFKVAKSPGNLNNHIGVPLSILSWPEKAEIAIVEMGTNHFGEIARLCEIAKPTHGLITNIGKGHIGFFETLDGVAKAKGELIHGLPDDGVAFLNKDDPFLRPLSAIRDETVLYGFSEGCDVQGEFLGLDDDGCPAIQVGENKVQLKIAGRHQAFNALAAHVVGLHFYVPEGQIKKALENFQPCDKRMQIEHVHGMTILNDSYNANPSSVEAALRTLAEMPGLTQRFAVLGDMLELGDSAEREHARIGELTSTLSLDGLFAFGPLMANAVKSVKTDGVTFAKHFPSKEELLKTLVRHVKSGDGILFKGSRGMAMETVLNTLKEEEME